MEQEKNPTVFASLTCGIVNELFGKVLKGFIRHVQENKNYKGTFYQFYH